MAVLKKIVVLHGAPQKNAGGLCKLKLTDSGTTGTLSLSTLPDRAECLLLQNGRVLCRFPVRQRLQNFEAARLEKGPFHVVVLREHSPLLYGGVETNLTLAQLFALLDRALTKPAATPAEPPAAARLEPLFSHPEITDPLLREDSTLGDDLESLIADRNYFDQTDAPATRPAAGSPDADLAFRPQTGKVPRREPPVSPEKEPQPLAPGPVRTEGKPEVCTPETAPQEAPALRAFAPTAVQTGQPAPAPSDRTGFWGEAGPGDQTTYYDTVKEEIEKLFGSFPHEPALEDLISDSRFVRVQYDERGRYYVVGVVYDRRDPAFICYGVPERYAPAPPKELNGFSAFVPKNPAKPYGEGYFMMFQSARTGQTLKDPHPRP